ncbi:MAG: hypothetical protein HC910_06385 [Spirulinaceae cyanobacterium SM2_1_0]|nr:hypothetical protein [Spirulinaceae cyanobacterium SM2_1_0]
MTDSNLSSAAAGADFEALRAQLQQAPLKSQLTAIAQLADCGDRGWPLLQDFLLTQGDTEPTPASGRAYQILAQSGIPDLRALLRNQFPNGLVPLVSERGIDYQPVQQALVAGDYETGDRLTLEKLCELAGPTAQQRNWLYFSEVEKFPSADLLSLDQLWRVYSADRFGYSVQRQLWLAQGKDFVKLWAKIGWKAGNRWTRYPNEFTWDLSAPRGHLPLSNQLRGARVLTSLLSHPAWTTTA